MQPVMIDVVHETAGWRAAPGEVVIVVDTILATTRLASQLDELPGGEPVQPEGDDLNALVERCADGALVVAGALVNARPCAAQVAAAARDAGSVTIACAGRQGRLDVADSYTAGVLARMLIDEVDAHTVLTDAAGVAITVMGGYESPRAALQPPSDADEALLRAVAHAATANIVPVVPELRDGSFVARPLAAPAG